MSLANAAETQTKDTISGAEFLASIDPNELYVSDETACRAWRYLADERFISDAPWSTVLELTKRFASVEEIEGVDDGARQSLRRRIKARLLQHPELVVAQGLTALSEALEASGYPANQRAGIFVNWMSGNDWRALPTPELVDLLSAIGVDAIDSSAFSARWRGELRPPRGGEYVLRQVPQYGSINSSLVVTIDGEEVLNSSDREAGEERFLSRPVALSPERAAAIEVRMVHRGRAYQGTAGGPMAVLTWKLGRGREEIIPAEAFTLPREANSKSGRGLRCEVFSDDSFGKLRATRTDTALDQQWSDTPIVPVHPRQYQAVVAECRRRVFDRQQLAKEAGNQGFLADSLPRIANRLNVTERSRLVEVLLSMPRIVEAIPPKGMGRLLQAAYILPGGLANRLVGEWSQMRPLPVTQPGVAFGQGVGSYFDLNVSAYQQIGVCYQGPYRERGKRLWDEYGQRQDGECNLAIAYALRSRDAPLVRRRGSRQSEIDAEIELFAADSSLAGDARATWLTALAYTATKQPDVERSEPLLQEAFLLAESEPRRFATVYEIAARYASNASTQKLGALLVTHAKTAAVGEQRAAIAALYAAAANNAAQFEARNARSRAGSQHRLLQLMKDRRERAAANGSKEQVERYDAIVDSLVRKIGDPVRLPR